MPLLASRQSLSFLQAHFGKSGAWYHAIARGEDERPVLPNRPRKSSGSETTFREDLAAPADIEADVIAIANDVWAWCEKTQMFGRTVTVKVKYADFQQATRSRTLSAPVPTHELLHGVSLDLVRSVYPSAKGIRLLGVTLSSFEREDAAAPAQLGLDLGLRA